MSRSRRRIADIKKKLRLETLEQRNLLAAEGLVGHWPLDIRASGSAYPDEVGTNHIISPPLPSADTALGQAIELTGTPPAQLHNFEPSLGDFGNGVTVSAWINRSNNGGFAFAIEPFGVQLGTEGNVVHFNVATTHINGQTNDNRVEAQIEIQNGTWYHIAGTYNGERLVVYVNGNDISSSDASGPLKMDGRLHLGTGQTLSDSLIRDFRGQLDDIKLFNRALNPDEILALSNAPSALETSDHRSVFTAQGDPVPIDPGVEISSERDHFGGGAMTVSFDLPTFSEGDRISIAATERIFVENNGVFFMREGAATQIGEVDDSNERGLRIDLNENATPAATEALARTLAYSTSAENPGTHDRLLTFLLATHQGVTAFADSHAVAIEQADTLVLATSEGASAYDPGGESIIVDPRVEIVSNQQNLNGGLLVISLVENSERASDQLSIRSTESISTIESGVYFLDQETSVLIGTLGGGDNGNPLRINLNENAGPAATEALARAIAYHNAADVTPDHPRFVRFALHDGKASEVTGVKKIEVSHQNVAPDFAVPDGATQFVEGSLPVAILPSVSVIDPDSPDFASGMLRVTFAEESAREGDRLSVASSELILIDGGNVFRSDTVPLQRIGEVDVIEDGRVVVFHFNEHVNHDLSELIARTVHFGNETNNPEPGNRFVRFELSDGDGGSDADVRRVEVASVNEAPVVGFSAGATEYIAGSEPVLVDPSVEVGDSDSPDFGGGKLIASFAQQSRRSGDQLGLRAAEGISIQGSDIFLAIEAESIKIAGFGFSEGELIIEFNENASIAAVQKVARLITYGSELAEASDADRFVRFTVTDGDGGEAFGVRRIEVSNVNVDPVVAVTEEASVFEVSADSIIIAPRIEIGDADSENFAGGSLVVTIIEQTGVDGDSIGVRSGEGITVDGNLVFSVDGDAQVLLGEISAATGEGIALTIELTEHATPALTQRLARRITFGSTVDVVGDQDLRFVQFTVSDGDGGSGADVARIELLLRPDGDLDGVDDQVERAAPNQGDGNHDGIPDSEQDRVASVLGNEDRFVTIASPENTRLLNVQPMGDPGANDPGANDRPAGTEFPVGFFDFQVDGVAAAETTMVTLILEPGTSANTYYVFGGTPEDPNPHWYPFLYDGQTGAKIFGDRIELYYLDGQRGDSDLTENGIIADPGAPGLVMHPWQNPQRIGDVNNDGRTSALDALLIINDMARNSPRSLPVLPQGSEQLAGLFLDVSGDDESSALDALRVINLLASNALAAQQEREIALPILFGCSDDDDQRQWDAAIEAVVGELF